ncbi:MAG TPA: tetratricopeptide repeat protein [Terriglobales bacterium]|nr:tetratricopeptide repeat protein [Terriglobales bacterium]
MSRPSKLARCLTLLLTLLLLVPPDGATCGGGGGGGMGGMGGGSSMPDQTFPVPWKIVQPSDPAPTAGLALYWLPSSQTELEQSSLRYSRTLSLYASQCVSMGVVDYRTELGQKLLSGGKTPLAVLAQPDGTALAKAENKNGFLKVDQVEKMLETEMKTREDKLKQQMDEAKEKAKSGDQPGAIALYRSVYEQKCMFPGKAKDAAKQLKKLGVQDVAEVPDAPIFDARVSARIEQLMQAGLKAENAARYREAERLYSQAHRLDPADPTPLRYLGELYRHELGDWDKAAAIFHQVLDMPADPLSRAVALHGLGKMTIHNGEFKKGLGLMEQSVEVFPLALAYRNLAVYWNSEGDAAKTDFYVRKALALEPKDPFNLVFAAVFEAQSGHTEEALKIARQNQALLMASYNLAAIYAQAGQKDKALALLQRHFFTYERYQAVRSKEMMEARVDAVFLSLRNDPKFLALTKDADGRLPMPMGTPRTGANR